MTATAAHRVEEGRRSLPGLMLRQARARTTVFVRTPIAAFFTLAFPLVFLVLVGALVGNEVVESRSGVRIAQFLTPAIGAYAAATAAYQTLAIGLAEDRDQGVLRRQRSLPVPTAALLGGRVLSGAAVGLLGIAIMVLYGVVRLDVQIVTGKLPAALLTALVGIACFAALGFAVASLARTSPATQAITSATLVPLAFVSDVFVVGDGLPRALEVVGGIFPLKAFANAMGETFNPFTPGSGLIWSHLALMAVWGVGGILVATRWFAWEAPAPSRRAPAPAPRVVDLTDAASGAVQVGSASTARLLLAQVRAGTTAIVRTPSSAFFTLAFPVVMLLLFVGVFGTPTLDDRGGVVLAQHLAPALAVFGIATSTYAELAERLAIQREQGVLKRVRGTPLTLGVFVAGRIGAAIALGLATTVLVLVVGVALLDVEVPVARIPLALVVIVVALATFTLLGLALVALAPTASSVPAMANGTLLPLGFVSDVFLVGTLPPVLQRVADVLPLRPAVTALSDVLNPALDVGVPWARLGVVVAWGLVALVVVRTRFTWEPRSG